MAKKAVIDLNSPAPESFPFVVTFKVPGQGTAELRLDGRYLEEEPLQAFNDRFQGIARDLQRLAEGGEEADTVSRDVRTRSKAMVHEAVMGWDKRDTGTEYSTEALDSLLSRYPAAQSAILFAYLMEASGAQVKN